MAQWEEAIEWCGRALAEPAREAPLHGRSIDPAAANAWVGHDKEAREAVAHLLKVYPGFTVQKYATIHFSDDPTFNAQHARIIEGLRKAGLPEGEKKTD